MKPIINDEFLLQRFPGKGGWTYVIISNVTFEQRHSMWAKVKGKIDGHQFDNLSLARTKDGDYFFPIKTEIRKIIKKQAGDTIDLILFEDLSIFKVPDDIIECLKIEDGAYQKFLAQSKSDQKQYVKWILSAKKDETKAERINRLINILINGEKF